MALSNLALMRNELLFARNTIQSSTVAELVDDIYLPAIDAAPRKQS